jgi:biopolymer transport protein ExbD
MGGGGGGEGEPSFQIAPMIDVLLVLLIFFMSITTTQIIKLEKNITLPIVPNGQKREEDKENIALLINISWNKATSQATFKLDDKLIDDVDGAAPSVKDYPGKSITDVLKARLESGQKLKMKVRMVVRADKEVHAKYLQKALQWGAEAGVADIAFAGKNKADGGGM